MLHGEKLWEDEKLIIYIGEFDLINIEEKILKMSFYYENLILEPSGKNKNTYKIYSKKLKNKKHIKKLKTGLTNNETIDYLKKSDKEGKKSLILEFNKDGISIYKYTKASQKNDIIENSSEKLAKLLDN